MYPTDLERLPGMRWVVPPPDPALLLRAAYTSDLLSDVMAHAPEDSALITLQAHANTIAVAALVGIRVIVICHERPIPADMSASAKREHIALLTTPLNQLEASHQICQILEQTPC
jgi:hypothetical protein